MWWWLAIALAAPPTGAPATLPVGAGEVDSLVVSGDGRLVAMVAGGAVHLLDTDDWSIKTEAPCVATSVALEYYAVDTHYAWVGCADGDVRLLLWESGEFGPVEEDGEILTSDLGDGRVRGVWTWDTGGLVYALSDTEENLLRLHVIEADSGAIDEESQFPISVPFDGYTDGVAAASRLIVFHGGSEATQLVWGGNAVLPNLQNYPVSVVDAAPTRF